MSTTPPPPETATPAQLEEYTQWRALGKGGAPANWDGFTFIKNAEKEAFSDTLTPTLYDHPEKYASKWNEASDTQRAAAQKPFLKEALPLRAEPRAQAKYFLIPQRERNADEPRDPVVEQAYQGMFDKMTETNTDTEWKTSVLEKRGKALFLKESVPISPIMELNHREICHIHGSDLSGHVTLSFPDAKEVIAKGWGERHRLSGTERLPLGYTMVYIPRSVEEVDVFAKIFQAGVEFMRSG